MFERSFTSLIPVNRTAMNAHANLKFLNGSATPLLISNAHCTGASGVAEKKKRELRRRRLELELNYRKFPHSENASVLRTI